MNPNGLVPTLVDEHVTLFESAAILRYLAARHARFPFWPEDPVARAPVDMWAEWGKTTLQPSFLRPVFWPALHGSAPDEKSLAAFETNLDILEARLGDGPWLLGPDFTLADIEVGLPLYRYFTVEIARRDRPALAAYYARLTERPAYADARHGPLRHPAADDRLMQADYVIVGSGSAGSALAYRLGEAGHSVAVIEYGGSDWGPFIQMPAALSYPMNMARYDWGFRTEPEPHLGGRTLATPRGKVLGGSSSINGMVYVRGHPRDFDTWAEMGADGWSWRRRRPLLQAHGALARRPLRLARPRRPAARHPRPAPQPALPRLRRGRRPGRLRAHLRLQRRRSRRASARWSRPSGAAAAGPPPTPTCARRSPAATSPSSPASPPASSSREGRATGVEVVRPSGRETIAASREVILAASSINTPKLLMLSGIGPADHLAEHGSPVVADRPGVGANLQDHLELYIQMRSLKPVTLYSQYNYLGMARIGLQWLLAKGGLGTSNQFESAAFVRSAPGVEYPDIQYHFLPLAVRYDGRSAVKGHGFQAHVGPMRSPSRGTVRLKSADPAAPPAIRFNYMAHRAGLDRLPPLHPPDPRALRPAGLPPLRRRRDPARSRRADRRRARRLRPRARRERLPPLRHRPPRPPRRPAGGHRPRLPRDRRRAACASPTARSSRASPTATSTPRRSWSARRPPTTSSAAACRPPTSSRGSTRAGASPIADRPSAGAHEP